jgi:hypothetical protein
MENNNVTILAANDSEANIMASNATIMGMNVEGKKVWTGIVPPDSFEFYAPGVRISTAEYFTFRNSNLLDEKKAVLFTAEMLSHFRTSFTEPNAEGVEILDEPRLGAKSYRNYLDAVKDTSEGKKALEVLDKAVEIVEPFEADMTVKLMFSALFDGGFEL